MLAPSVRPAAPDPRSQPKHPAPDLTRDLSLRSHPPWAVGGPALRPIGLERRRVKLTDEDRAELLTIPEDFPRTGAQLRAWRNSHGIGTPPPGEACGVSYQAVQQWERKGDGPAKGGRVVLKLHLAALRLRLT